MTGREMPAPQGRPPKTPGRCQSNQVEGKDTSKGHPGPQGAYLRLHGDHETLAAELIDRIGPTAALILAAELLLQADGVIR